MRAVILAGGRGTRLAPYTTFLPKPLLPVGEMPILEFLIRRLKAQGIEHVTLSVGYLSSLLLAFFGDGARFGVTIDYSQEQEPLGTAGPIALVPGLTDTFLAMNGDLLTDLDLRAMVDFHRERGAVATVGVYGRRSVPIDFGVIELDDAQKVTGYIEKPVYNFPVSMGVYVFEPSVLNFMSAGQRLDLPDLIRSLIGAGHPVFAYLHSGYWLDIGRPDDYQLAQEDFPRLSKLLGDSEKREL